MTQVRVYKAHMEQPAIGYVVMPLPQMGVIYGTFDTQEQAVSYAQQLDNAEVYPIYAPTIH